MRYPFKEHKKEYEENQVKLEQDIVKTYVESESWAQFMIESDLKGFFYGVSGKIEKFAIWCAYVSFNRSMDLISTIFALIGLLVGSLVSVMFIATMGRTNAVLSISATFIIFSVIGLALVGKIEYWRIKIQNYDS